MSKVWMWLGVVLLAFALAACTGGGTAGGGSRTLEGKFLESGSTVSITPAASAVQAASRDPLFRAGEGPAGVSPLAGLWAPIVETSLWSEGDRVVASRADGEAGTSAAVAADGTFTLTLQLNVTYSLQLVRDGEFIAYLAKPDGTPINIRVTATGASIDLGTISVQDGKFVSSTDPGDMPGVSDDGLPADYDERLAELVEYSATLLPTGIPAEELYEGAIFLAVDADGLMVGMGTAPDGELTISVPEGLESSVRNFVTLDMAFLGEVEDLPANTPTYAIQVPYFEVDHDLGIDFPEAIDDGSWGLFSATVVDEFGDPLADALVAAVSIAEGGDETPPVMILNIGRTDSLGRVQFYVLHTLDSDAGAEWAYTYSLVAARSLDADFEPLYGSGGEPVRFTPVPGESPENVFEITLGEPEVGANPYLGTWEMYGNHVGHYGSITFYADGSYVWEDGAYRDEGTWTIVDEVLYFVDSGDIEWSAMHGEDAEGEYLDIYTKIGSSWSHWGYGLP